MAVLSPSLATKMAWTTCPARCMKVIILPLPMISKSRNRCIVGYYFILTVDYMRRKCFGLTDFVYYVE